MIGKLLETFCRYWLLLLLPLVLIPLVVGPIAYVKAPAYYETFAGVWVGTLSGIGRTDDFSQWLSPSQNQS